MAFIPSTLPPKTKPVRTPRRLRSARLPGFGPCLCVTLVALTLIVLLPLSTLIGGAATIGGRAAPYRVLEAGRETGEVRHLSAEEAEDYTVIQPGDALEVADELIVMNRGHIEQQGSAEALFQQPKSEFVMNFLGEVNVLRGHFGHGDGVRILVRPHDFAISTSVLADGLPAEVIRVLTAGAMVKLELLDRQRQVIYVHLSYDEFARQPVRVGEQVYLTAKSSRLFRDGESFAPEYQI